MVAAASHADEVNTDAKHIVQHRRQAPAVQQREAAVYNAGPPAHRPTGLTYAQHPAGTLQPASSGDSGSSVSPACTHAQPRGLSPPRPHPRRDQARFSGPLTALAVLLGAFGLFHAAPAEAQPPNITVIAASSTSFKVSWGGSSASCYDISLQSPDSSRWQAPKLACGGSYTYSTESVQTRVSENVYEYTEVTLSAGVYKFRMRSVATGAGPWGRPRSVTVGGSVVTFARDDDNELKFSAFEGAGGSLNSVTIKIAPVLTTASTVRVRRGGGTTVPTTGLPATVPLPANAATATFNVPTVDDLVAGPSISGTLVLELEAVENAPYALGADQRLTGVVTEDDVVTASFSRTAATTFEGLPVIADIVLDKPATYPITVTLTTGADDDDNTANATDGEDYRLEKTELTIPPGQTQSDRFTLLPLTDGVDESNEIVLVKIADLSGAGRVEAGPDPVKVTIQDAAKVSLSASPNPVPEGSPVTVTVTLSTAITNAHTRRIEVHARTAEVEDFGVPGGVPDEENDKEIDKNVSFAAGATSATFTITTARDTDSYDETFVVFSSSLGLGNQVTVRIADDTSLQVRVHNSATYEMLGGSAHNGLDTYGLARVELDRPATHKVTVDYATEDDTARSDGTTAAGTRDYTAVSGTLTFEEGDTTRDVRVPVHDDDVEDNGEEFQFVLSNPSDGLRLHPTEAVGIIEIRNNEARLDALRVEGASDAGGPYAPLDIGTFVAETTEYTVTVPHGTTHARLVPTADEDLALSAGAGADLTRVRTGEAGPSVALAVGDNILRVETRGAENQQTYRVTVTREAQTLSSNADLSGLTAEAGTDGSWSALDIGAFAAGTTSYSARVPYATTHARLTATAADATATLAGGGEVALSEGGNALSVEVTATDGATKTYTVTVTREARPEPLTASFENIPATHDGESAFAVDVRFSEALDGGSGPTAASFDVAYGRAKAVELVEAGVYRVSVMPKSFRDARVTLAGRRDCGAAGTVCTADGRALENTSTATVGGPVRIRIEGGTAREGRDAGVDFAVTLNRASSETVSVDYATADDSAKAGEDYEAVSGTLRFAAGETEKTLHVPVLDDDIDEGNEKFKMRLSNESGAYLRKHSPPSDGNDQEHGPDSGGAAGALRPCDRRAGGDAHRGAHGGAAAERVQGALRRA